MTDIDDAWDDTYDSESYRDDESGDDRYDEYKDDLAMGYINPDGSQRDPDPPDPWDYRPSLRVRLRWRLRALRWRVRAIRHHDRYYDEPPF